MKIQERVPAWSKIAVLPVVLGIVVGAIAAFAGGDDVSGQLTPPRALAQAHDDGNLTSVNTILRSAQDGRTDVCLFLRDGVQAGAARPHGLTSLEELPPGLVSALREQGLAAEEFEVRNVVGDSVVLGSLNPVEIAPDLESDPWLAGAVEANLFDSWHIVELGFMFECDPAEVRPTPIEGTVEELEFKMP